MTVFVKILFKRITRRTQQMKTQLFTIYFSAFIVITSLSACSSNAPRITPGQLEVSERLNTHTAKITNIVQLSEQEAPNGKVFLGSLTGALMGAALTNGKNDTIQNIAADIGGEVAKTPGISHHC